MNAVLNFIKDTVLSAIRIILMALIIYAFLYICSRFIRWFKLAKIERQKNDFCLCQEYIIEEKVPVSKFQKVYLNLFGEIFSLKDWLFLILFSVIYVLLIYGIGLLIPMLVSKKTWKIIRICFWINSALGALFCIFLSIKGLKKYARWLPTAISIFLFIGSLLVLFKVI